jgi:hypothetical protein
MKFEQGWRHKIFGPGWRYRLRIRQSGIGYRGGRVEDKVIGRLVREKDFHQLIEYIFFLANEDHDLAEARVVYRAAFGVRFDDKIIDKEIERQFVDDTISESRSNVKLPAKLVLALILREGFAGRKRGKSKSPEQVRTDSILMRRRKKLIDELRQSKNLSFADAAGRAAEVLSKQSRHSISAIREGRLDRPRRPRQKRSGR